MSEDPPAPTDAQLWQLLDAVPLAMVVIGLDGRIRHASERALRLFGYDRAELTGQLVELLVPERFRAAHPGQRSSYFAAVPLRTRDVSKALFGRRKDGSEFPAEITLAPVGSGDGALVSAAIRDVTDRDRAEAQARASEARYQGVLDHMLEAVQILDFDWRYLYLNDAAARNGRQRKEEMLGRTVMERYPGFETTELFARLRQCMEGRTAGTAELEFTYPDASTAWFEFSIQPVPQGLFVLSLDVTERKLLDLETRERNTDLEERVRARTAELEEANGFLTAIIENLPSMVFVKDAERLAFVRFNRAGEALLGVSREQLLGKNDHDFFPTAEADFFQAKDRETLRSRQALDIPEEPLETARGRRWLHTRKVPILGEDGAPRFLLGISEDITEQKQADETRARLAALVDSSDDAIVGTTLTGVVTSWNRGAERIFGYSAEEMVGQLLAPLFPASRKDEAALLSTRLERGERIDHFESVRLRKDGREIDVSVSISPIRDPAGAITGTSKIARDITELKRNQEALARAKDAAEAANRELESFSYSVAHDLRAPLRSIDGFSQALLEDYGEKLEGDGRKYLTFVRESAQQMAGLIDDLLALSRVTRSELNRAAIDLTELARAAVTRLQRSQPGRTVQIELQEGLGATGDPRLIAVLLDNLLGNAWKFTGKRADARIELGAVPGGGPPVYFVRDNGAGFDMAYVGKLFGVFQRLHSAAEFEGTGVGLATVQRVVRRHGGRVWAKAQVGEGATFFFTLQEQERLA